MFSIGDIQSRLLTPKVFDPAQPLRVVSAVRHLGELHVCISAGEVTMDTTWIVDVHRGIGLINPAPATEAKLGILAALAPRTFVGPISRKLDANQTIVFPIDLPCWWQGGGTPNWVDW